MTTLSSREMNHDIGRAKKATAKGPVIITDRGRPAHVLMTYEAYERLVGSEENAAHALAMPGGGDIEFDPPRSRDLGRAADFS